jgi:hypothetical protein
MKKTFGFLVLFFAMVTTTQAEGLNFILHSKEGNCIERERSMWWS